MNAQSLGDRMKSYEGVTKHQLQPRTPVIIRVDGKAFHTLTAKFTKPFSKTFHKYMMSTAIGMCSEIQNAKIAYTQSDEISILLNDWEDLESQQWFAGGLQKIASVSSSIATAHFNYRMAAERGPLVDQYRLPQFDARVFQLPKEEVNNYFIWRQQDAARNSIQALGHSLFSTSEMYKKSNIEVQDMMLSERNVDWNDLSGWKRLGACVHRSPHGMVADSNIPWFSEDKDYINTHLKTNSRGAITCQ